MMRLIFATNNRNKVNEIRSLLDASRYELHSLEDAGIRQEIPEPHDTLEKNALEKASVIYRLTGTPCFSEDTGLEVEALNGEPGVRSARYAGEDSRPGANIDKLLDRMKGVSNRAARFRTVLCYIRQEGTWFFEGICRGTILLQRRGGGGFGYDPVFVPEGSDRTFAEMELAEKNQYSHRQKATRQLLAFLESGAAGKPEI